jgi:hypothetical protein
MVYVRRGFLAIMNSSLPTVIKNGSAEEEEDESHSLCWQPGRTSLLLDKQTTKPPWMLADLVFGQFDGCDLLFLLVKQQ